MLIAYVVAGFCSQATRINFNIFGSWKHIAIINCHDMKTLAMQ